MHSGKRGVLLLGTLGLLLAVAAPSAGAATEARTPYIDGMLRKLGRGVTNIVTCPAELLRQPELVGRRDGYLAAMSVGLLQGAWRTLQRGVVGAFEVVTFPVEVPKDFAPLMRPEYVFGHGNWME
jgi:putative exosortase-associated protein (TIGR04073 family)